MLPSDTEQDILGQVNGVLIRESGKSSIDPEWTLTELFEGNRLKYTTAMLKIEQRLGKLCESKTYQRLFGKSIEFFRWAVRRNLVPEVKSSESV